ncbi:MAG: RsmE family RNA methyltransferase [Candidatus Omnitrophota bacterium]
MATTRRFLSSSPISGSTVSITGDELHHLIHVNRAKCGDPIEIVDGAGTWVYGKIRMIKSGEAAVDILREERMPKPSRSIIMAPSLLKQQPMNLMIEKLAEIGVDEIRPVLFQRTDDTFQSARLEKWKRIAFQTLKVNKRLWATDIHPPVPLAELKPHAGEVKSTILLDISGKRNPAAALAMDFPAMCVIGPPGGILEEEREQLIREGFAPYNINDCILKTETASLCIAAVLKLSLDASVSNAA